MGEIDIEEDMFSNHLISLSIKKFPLNRHTKLEGALHGPPGVVHADDAEHEAEENDEHVVAHGVPRDDVAPELEVEKAWPDEGEAYARHVADESHQDGEMRNHHGEYDGDHYDDNAEGEAPHLQFAVERPNCWESCLGLALNWILSIFARFKWQYGHA